MPNPYRDRLIQRRDELTRVNTGPQRVRITSIVDDGDHIGLGRVATDRELGRIAATLTRMDAGKFGRCMFCKDAIDGARLEADPTTELCRRCSGR